MTKTHEYSLIYHYEMNFMNILLTIGVLQRQFMT